MRTTKTTKSYKSLNCRKCSRLVTNCGEQATAVICSMCTMIAVGFPEEKKKPKPTGRPAGWHFMAEFVDKNGNVFHKGKEQKKLKGTLKPTKVAPPKKRQSKRKSKEEMLIARDKEKKAALKAAVKKQKDFINHTLGDV